MTLHLQLRNRDLFPRARDEAWTDASRAEELQDSSDVASLINFLQLAQPCLQSLRLNFGNHRVWSLFSKIGPPAVSLSQLRCLELGVLFIEEQDLIDFLGKFDTIKEMTFFRVVLLDGSWASFLSNIPATLQSLRLNLVKQTGSPQEPGYNPNGKRVAFKKSPDVVPTHFTDGCIVPDYTIADSFDIKSKLDAAISVIIADDDDIFRLAHGGSNGSAASDSDADMDSDEEEDEDMGDEEESEEHEDE